MPIAIGSSITVEETLLAALLVHARMCAPPTFSSIHTAEALACKAVCAGLARPPPTFSSIHTAEAFACKAVALAWRAPFHMVTLIGALCHTWIGPHFEVYAGKMMSVASNRSLSPLYAS